MASAWASSRRLPDGGLETAGRAPGGRKRSGASRSRSRPASQAAGSGARRPAAARSSPRSARFETGEDETFVVTLVRVSLKVTEERVDLEARPAQADGHLLRLVEPHALEKGARRLAGRAHHDALVEPLAAGIVPALDLYFPAVQHLRVAGLEA